MMPLAIIQIIMLVVVVIEWFLIFKSPAINLFRYLYVSSLFSFADANHQKISNYLATDDIRKLVFFLSRKKVIRYLADITPKQINNLNYYTVRYTTSSGIGYNSAYYVACKEFMAYCPKYSNKLEYAMSCKAIQERDPNITLNFATVCKDEIKAKCRLFNTLSRMRKREYMQHLANIFDRTPEIEKLLRY